MNKKLLILPMLFAACGCSTVRSTDDIPNLVLPSVLRRLPDYLAIAEIRPCAGDGRGPVVALDSCENHNHPDRASRHAHQDGVRLGLRRLEARVS